MPPGRKPTRSREEFVDAAIALADREGIDNLTLQALGQALGASTTAVYRYFRDKDDLATAMREHLLGVALDAGSLPSDPREVILAMARSFRGVARTHPCLGQLMIQSALSGENAGAVPVIIVKALEQLGLSGETLVRGYRQLESFVVGVCVFDFSGAPTHVPDRRERMGRLGHPAFDAALADDQAVDADNEYAFNASLTCLLDALIAKARS